jgi:ATP-dependent protease ClpP protease subunit
MRSYKRCRVDSDSDEDDSDDVIVIDNHVWFYGSITPRRCLELHTKLFKLYKQEKRKQTGRIVLHLQTSGGCVFSGFSTHDIIKSMNKKIIIEIICEGEVSSSGTIIMLAANIRKIRKHGILLIHEISGGYLGKYSNLKDEMQNMDLFSNRLMELYKKHTNLKSKILKEILKKDIFFDANKSLACGLITEII